MNAFTSVRQRGPDLDIPAAPPRKTNRSAAPIEGNVQQALDRNGRRTVSLAPPDCWRHHHRIARAERCQLGKASAHQQGWDEVGA